MEVHPIFGVLVFEKGQVNSVLGTEKFVPEQISCSALELMHILKMIS